MIQLDEISLLDYDEESKVLLEWDEEFKIIRMKFLKMKILITVNIVKLILKNIKLYFYNNVNHQIT